MGLPLATNLTCLRRHFAKEKYQATDKDSTISSIELNLVIFLLGTFSKQFHPNPLKARSFSGLCVSSMGESVIYLLVLLNTEHK